MATISAQYSSMYSTTESDANGLSSDEITELQDSFNNNEHIVDDGMFRVLKPVLFQMQKMQSELDYLRGLISNNNDKIGITTAQANAITANTAKTSMVIGKNANEAMAGNTTIPNVTVTSGSGLVVNFGNLVPGKTSGATVELTITDHNQKSAPTYTALITLK